MVPVLDEVVVLVVVLELLGDDVVEVVAVIIVLLEVIATLVVGFELLEDVVEVVAVLVVDKAAVIAASAARAVSSAASRCGQFRTPS